jgi:thioredoxin-dependent peroxiredoxin
MIMRKLISKAAQKFEGKFQKHQTSLKVGDKAPAIFGIDQHGNQISMEQFKGKKIVLYFYPKDNTAGCTTQACSLRDNYQFMQKAGYEIIGVSPDSEEKHRKFIDKFQLPFPLISDPELKLIKSWDVWGEKQFLGRIYDGLIRTTFVINEKGIIEEVLTKIDTAEHAQQILKD